MKLRYTTWRRSITLAWVSILLCFAGLVAFPDQGWSTVFPYLIQAVIVASILFHLVVALLRKAGLLEFTYSDADRASYLYNMEGLHRQMTANRCGRKRE